MTDEKQTPDPRDEWSGDAILKMLRRQVAELKEQRAELILDPAQLPADDNPQLLHVILELRSLSQTADGIARELEQKTDDQNEGKTP